MNHGHSYSPAVARTPGGSDYPIAVDESLPLLPPATGVTVGVIDTGLVLDSDGQPHPWLDGHVQFRGEDSDPLEQGRNPEGRTGYLLDADGHGTFVTGLILREAPTARVAMYGALDKDVIDLDDKLGADDDTRVAAAVRELAQDPAVKVINLSFGGGVFAHERESTKLRHAIEELDTGIAVVAAAGNDSSTHPVYPAAFDNVIAVGALDERRLRPTGATPPIALFSNTGAWVDAYAAGVQVLGPYVTFDETGSDLFGFRPPQHFRGWARWSGSSFAAATVTGLIAQTAIERGVSGREAADAVLSEARRITNSGAVWIRSNS